MAAYRYRCSPRSAGFARPLNAAAFSHCFASNAARPATLSQLHKLVVGKQNQVIHFLGHGSQDAEGRQRLIQAIYMVQKDFSKILVITHLEELKDAFPSRIEVEKTLTGSQVKVVNG